MIIAARVYTHPYIHCLFVSDFDVCVSQEVRKGVWEGVVVKTRPTV